VEGFGSVEGCGGVFNTFLTRSVSRKIPENASTTLHRIDRKGLKPSTGPPQTLHTLHTKGFWGYFQQQTPKTKGS
jgi:hypothetical protein